MEGVFVEEELPQFRLLISGVTWHNYKILSCKIIVGFGRTMELQSSSKNENVIQLALKLEQHGDISGALRLARQALSAARSSNLPLDYGIALNAVARYRFRLGQYDTARELAQEALDLTNSLLDEQAAVHVESLLMLGMCALETNSIAECEQYYRRAANLAREIGHPLLFQRAMHNLGSGVYLFRGQFDLAIAADLQSLQICLENNFVDWAVFPLITLAIAYQITGQRIQTREALKELRALVQPGSAGEGYTCYVAGMLALDEDDFITADTQFSRALTLAENLGDPSLNLDTRLGISRMYRLSNEAAKALGWAEDALKFSQRVGYRIYLGRTEVEYGLAKWMTNDLLGAETNLLQAQAVFVEMDMRYDLAQVRLLLANLFNQTNDPRGLSQLQQAAESVKLGGYGFLLEREHFSVYSLAAHLDNPDPKVADSMKELLTAIQNVPPKPLKLLTLGKLDLRIGARMVGSLRLRQRHAGELLALLFSSPGHSLSADKIAEALCPEKDRQAAVDFYHHAISALRRILEPDITDRRFQSRYLGVNEESVKLLLPPGSDTDYDEFERSLQKKDWERAIELYQGEYLPMYCDSEWTISLRQHYADQFERVLLTQATELLTNGDAQTCLELSKRVLTQNSWQEQAVELGMRAALKLGDRSSAIKLYKKLEKTLDNDLGISPQIELQQLYKEIVKRPSTS